MNSEDIQFTISDQLFFATLLMEIRGKTISYSTYIKKMTNSEEKKLIEALEELWKINEHSEENLKKIDRINEDLEKIRSKRMEGVAIRARVRWIDKGEKATNYFCNLENRNYTNRTVSFLEKQTEETIYKQEDILKEVTNFYSNLYK